MSEFRPYQQFQPYPAGPRPTSLGVPATVVIVGLAGTIGAAVIGLAIQLHAYDEARAGRPASAAMGFAQTLIVVTLIFAVVAFICWLYRARVNLYYFGVYDLRWKPGWTIGGWFLPIANLVIPLLVVNEVDRASAVGGPGGRSTGRGVFVLWAMSWTGYLLLGRFANVGAPSLADLSARDLDRAAGQSVVSTMLQIAAAVFAIRLVRRVTANQEGVLAAVVPQPPHQRAFYPPEPYAAGSMSSAGTGGTPPADPALPPVPGSSQPGPEQPTALPPPSDPWPSAGF